MKKINIEKIGEAARMIYIVYMICYIAASVVTLLILNRDQIKTFIKKVVAGCKSILLHMTIFFKRLQVKIHPTKVDKECVKECFKEAMAGAPVIRMDDLEFACEE